MTRKVVQALWIVFVVSISIGCNGKPENAMPIPANTPNDSSIMSDLAASMTANPMDSDSPHIRLVKATPNGKLFVILAGKKQSLAEIACAMSENLSKPVKFDDDVDSQQISEQFEITMHDGSWSNLLSLIVSEFDCSAEEMDDAYFIKKK